MRAGTLVVDIAANVARLQTDMASAKGIVAGAMNDITRSVNVAKQALGALGVGLGAGALANMALGINKATAALDDMAEVTGTAVENLSRFQVVARVGSHDMGLVEDSLVKLTKGLKGTDEETKNARNALEQLGIKAKTAAGQQRDAGEIMREVAAKFATFQDGVAKTGFALDIFGKSGAKLLPFLKDMAEEGTVAARVTAEQAAQAEKLEKNLNRLRIAAEDSKREFLMGITPALVDFTQKLVDAQKAAGGLVAGLALLATTKAGGNVPDRLAEIDKEIASSEANARVAEKLGSFGWGSVAGIGAKIGGMGAGVNVGRLMAEREFLVGRLGRNASGMEDDLSGTWRPPAALARGVRKPPPEAGKGKTLADLLAETSGLNKDFYEDLGKLHAGYTSGTITLDRYQEAVTNLIEKQKFAKDLDKQQTETLKSLNEAAIAREEQEKKQISITSQFRTSLSEAAQQLEFENSLIESSADVTARSLAPKSEALRLEIEATAAREKAVEFRRIDLELNRKLVDATPETTAALYELAEAEKVRVGAAIDAKASRTLARDSASAAAEEWKSSQSSMWQSIDRTAHDTFVSIFDSGKNAFDRLRDTLKNGLFDLLYQMTVRPFIVNIAALVSGGSVAQSAFGSTGGGLGGLLGGGGGGGGAGGLGNLASLGSSAYSAISGNSIWSSIGGALGIGGGAAISGTALAAEAAALTGSGMATGALAGGAMAGIGAAIPYVGLALAAYSLLSSDGGSDALPEIQLGFQHPGVDQSRFSNDAIYRQAATEMEAAHRAMYSVSWTQPNANGDGSPTEAVRSGIEERYQQLMVPVQAQQAVSQAQQASLSGNLLGGNALASTLRGYVDSQAVSQYLSPEERLSGARSLFDTAVQRAGAGDLAAGQALPGLANQLLGVGRENFASGSQFQSLRADVNDQLAQVLEQNGQAQVSLLAEMPAAIREAANDTVTQLKTLREEVKAGLAALNAGLRQFQAGGA